MTTPNTLFNVPVAPSTEPTYEPVDSEGMPRKPAQVVLRTDLWRENGVLVRVEVTGDNGGDAIDALTDTIAYAVALKGWSGDPKSIIANVAVPTHTASTASGFTPAPPQGAFVPTPPAPPASTSTTGGGARRAPEMTTADGHEVIKVESMKVQVTSNGKKYMLIKGAPYLKNGLHAWPEILPADVQAQLESYPVGTEGAPPASMAYAITSRLATELKWAEKVVAFSPTI